ncbi:hypothetical protein F8388_009714 [Cannabis sativa]|uniref:non-specific serine/threonine protein kinase n=1 Tax=Cannabis sativa TaxID=3483 RepID=A0A7J6GEQ8_CANSA|nr:hypothetical protein G4B88_008740 [Cannabis sativa]KAF4389581.1 hypothetical protein F8388_009714 [Cannabis sativa]
MPEIEQIDGNIAATGSAAAPENVLFGKYEVGRLLGCGAFAKVHHARDVRSGQSVAIKIINKKKLATPNLRSNAKREISVMKRLRHPNIVKLHEVLASKTKIYFVMEFVKGGELFAKVAKGRFSEDLSRKYFRQLISAVGYCHSRGIFHRDLKPENLLLDENGNLKVSDFGLSAIADDQIRSDGLLHTLCGTPAYVAPEILNQRGYDGAKIDVWSCGVVLFVLTAGYLPFNDGNLMALYKKIYKGEYRCPRWMSPDLKRFLSRLLETNPETRITIDEILKDPWFRKGGYRAQINFYDEESEPAPKMSGDGEHDPKDLSLANLNAFDIISFSSGLDLSGLFDLSNNSVQEGERLISQEWPEKIIQKVDEFAKGERLRMKTKKEFGVEIEGHNGKLVMGLEVYRLTETLVVVEAKRKGEFNELSVKNVVFMLLLRRAARTEQLWRAANEVLLKPFLSEVKPNDITVVLQYRMFEDVASRSKLTKKLKISGLKFNSTKDTKKKTQRTRSDNEDGGMKNFSSDKPRRGSHNEDGGMRNFSFDKPRRGSRNEDGGMRNFSSNKQRRGSSNEDGGMRNFSSDKTRKRSYNDDGGLRKFSYDKTRKKVFDEDGGVRNSSFDKTRKRIYADRETGGEVVFDGNVDRPNRKPLSKKWQSQGKDEVVRAKGKNVSPRSMWVSSKLEDTSSEAKVSSHKAKNTVENEQISHVARTKGIDKKKSQDMYSSNSTKKWGKDKKNQAEDLEVLDEQPKKSKRVIRIDPHDISNKRLVEVDNSLVNVDSKTEKKNVMEEPAEVSKNAQFRAIQPSSSILSYVEDNVICMRPSDFLGRRRMIELRRAGYNTDLSAPLDNIPFSSNLERERIEETIFRNKMTFFAAAKASSSFPPPELPEIAFAGRSNVGKSSLLNSLTRQWGVVRTSDKPGLTQTINFFDLGSKLCLVDLPGYGFAYAKEEVKDAWEELVKEYVSTRVGLRRVCLLIDTKWGMKPRDHELIDLMERSQTKYQIVLTKTDTVFPIDSLKAHKSVVQPLMMVSSKSGAGIRSLRTVLAKISRYAKL